MANLSDKIAPAGVVVPGDNISTLTNDSGYLTGITGQSIKNLSDVLSSMTPTDGQVLTYDTTNGWQAEDAGGGGGLQSVQIFTSSGTWTRPAGITKVKVYVTGGGGGGYRLFTGGGTYAYFAGTGGGTAIKLLLDVSSISSATITVGAGASYAGTGGTSSWADGTNTYSATGGQGSQTSVNAMYNRMPGIGSGADLNLRGGVGVRSGSSTDFYAVAGGTFWTMHGLTGSTAYGAGAAASSSGNAVGSAGIVIVEEYA